MKIYGNLYIVLSSPEDMVTDRKPGIIGLGKIFFHITR